MQRRPSPAIALCLSASLLLQVMGCSSTDSCIKYRVKGDAPHVYYVTYDSIQCIGRGKEVILSLKNSSIIRGRFWGVDTGRKPLAVYAVLPEHLPQIVDTLKKWVPASGEHIIVFSYPSSSVVFEGSANNEI